MAEFIISLKKNYLFYGFFKNRCYNVITTIAKLKINKNLKEPYYYKLHNNDY
jgi:hypothetical protein